MQLLAKLDTGLYFHGPPAATLQLLLWPDGSPDFPLTFKGTIATGLRSAPYLGSYRWVFYKETRRIIQVAQPFILLPLTNQKLY